MTFQDRRIRGLLPCRAAWPLAFLAVVLSVAACAAASPAVGLTADVDVAAEGAMPLQANAQVDQDLATTGFATGAPALPLPGDALETSSIQLPASPRGGPWAGTPLQSVEVQAAAGVAGVAASAGLALWALAPLYSRLDKGELLNHPVRRELMRIISQDPGVNISDLHGRFDLGWGSLLYHLQRLEGQGLVMSHRWGRSRRYFLNQRGLELRAPGIRALKAANARVLAEHIVAQPGSTQEQLAQTLNLSKSVVSKYAKRLSEANLVQREVGRNCLRLFPTMELRELLHTAQPITPTPAADPERPRSPEQGAPALSGDGDRHTALVAPAALAAASA